MSQRKSYAQHLRVIGQALDAKRISVFELKSQGNQYIVRGEPDTDSSLVGKLRHWRERIQGHALASSFTYAPPDIEKLDREGKSRRSKPGRLPDFYSLSNALRTVGSYLDSQGAELLEIHKSSLNVTLLYRNKDGHPNMEERSLASFYDLFIALHGRRKKHAGT